MISENISIAEISHNARMILDTLPTKDDGQAELRLRLRTLTLLIGNAEKKSAAKKLGQRMSLLDDYASDIVLYSFYIAREHPLGKHLLFRRDDSVNTVAPVGRGVIVYPPAQVPVVQPVRVPVIAPEIVPVIAPEVDFNTKVLIKNLTRPREFFIEFTDDPEKRKLDQDEDEFVVYDDSTIGQIIMGKKAGFPYELNKMSYRILEVFRKGLDRSAQ